MAGSVESIPQWNRHAEVALATDEPVAIESAYPIGVAVLHEVGVPGEVIAASGQCVAQVLVTSAVADIPLAAGDDLKRTVALLEELHGVRNGARLSLQGATLAEQFDDYRLCLLHRLAG